MGSQALANNEQPSTMKSLLLVCTIAVLARAGPLPVGRDDGDVSFIEGQGKQFHSSGHHSLASKIHLGSKLHHNTEGHHNTESHHEAHSKKCKTVYVIKHEEECETIYEEECETHYKIEHEEKVAVEKCEKVPHEKCHEVEVKHPKEIC